MVEIEAAGQSAFVAEVSLRKIQRCVIGAVGCSLGVVEDEAVEVREAGLAVLVLPEHQATWRLAYDEVVHQ